MVEVGCTDMDVDVFDSSLFGKVDTETREEHGSFLVRVHDHVHIYCSSLD